MATDNDSKNILTGPTWARPGDRNWAGAGPRAINVMRQIEEIEGEVQLFGPRAKTCTLALSIAGPIRPTATCVRHCKAHAILLILECFPMDTSERTVDLNGYGNAMGQ